MTGALLVAAAAVTGVALAAWAVILAGAILDAYRDSDDHGIEL